MKTLESQIIELTKDENKKFENDAKLKEFENALSNFNLLVEKGLVKRRGYNLMSIEEMHLNRVVFNAKD